MNLQKFSLSQEDTEFLFRCDLAAAEFKYGVRSGEVGLVLLRILQHSRTTGASFEIVRPLEERIKEISRYYEQACAP